MIPPLTRVDELLHKLSSCPPGHHAQIDDAVTPRLQALLGKPPSEQAVGLEAILHDCAYGALASDFAMMAMDATWKMALEDARSSGDDLKRS